MNPHLHSPSWRLNTFLLAAIPLLAAALWPSLPQPYPIHFGWSGEPDRWATGPGMWILLVAICTISVGQLHLLQRFLVLDARSPLLNIPWKEEVRRLPRERQDVVMRRVNRMLGLVNTTVALVFLAILVLIHVTARDPRSPAALLARASFWIVLLLTLLLPLVETVGMRRMIRRKLEEEGLWRGERDRTRAGRR